MEEVAVKRAAWMVAALVLIAATAISLEFVRPGSMMCPLRRALDMVDIDMPVQELSSAQEARAAADAKKWYEQALKRYPVLQVEMKPVPLEENGFYQLIQLEHGRLPATDFGQLLRDIATQDPADLQQALDSEPEWLAGIERIANLSKRSSADLPGGPVWFIGARDIKAASDTLLLHAIMAARSGDQAAAMRRIHQSGNLADHLQLVESPSLLSETVVILIHLGRLDIIHQQILPALGRQADLAAWKHEIERLQISPARLGDVLRGEWWVCAGATTNQWFAAAHYQRMLRDPEALAMAHAESTSRLIPKLHSATWNDLLTTGMLAPPPPSRLSHEAKECWMALRSDAWSKGFIRSARVRACHLAILELLMQEAEGKPPDVAAVTHDPLTGMAMVFDAKARTLDLPPGHSDMDLNDPLKLPW